MEIHIKATNIHLNDEIHEYLNKRLKALDKLIDSNDTSILCKVEVEQTTNHHKSGDIYRAEIRIHIAGHDFGAEATADRLFDAIDEAKTQMAKELRRSKNKNRQNMRRGGAKIKEFFRRLGRN